MPLKLSNNAKCFSLTKMSEEKLSSYNVSSNLIKTKKFTSGLGAGLGGGGKVQGLWDLCVAM